MQRNWARGSIALLLALTSSWLMGCQTCSPGGAGDVPPASAELPLACKNKVWVFFHTGLDPLDLAHLAGTRDHVQGLGFHKTYYGHPVHAGQFADELVNTHRACPEARFVLIGYGHGAAAARELACRAEAEGIAIDLLVYLDGSAEPLLAGPPGNVRRAISLTGKAGRFSAGADNHVLDEAGHLGTPTHEQTLRLLGEELGAIAASVPIVSVAPAIGPMRLPPPAGWGFLSADTHALGIERCKPMADAWSTPPPSPSNPFIHEAADGVRSGRGPPGP